MNLVTKELHEVYMEALRLHKLSWQKRIEGKRPWYKKDVFDDSHLPKNLWDTDYRYSIYDKLIKFIDPMFLLRDSSGHFAAVLNSKEALNLLLAPDLLNSHYKDGSEVNLAKYNVGAYTFKIQIIDEN